MREIHGTETIVIYSVYLPPENSKYGQFNEQILNMLTIEIYREGDSDLVMICGDLNARVANKDDCELMPDIKPRKSLDGTCNSQGLKLIDFTNDCKMCIVNGRITPDLDDFTSITSYRGKAVVDYSIVRCCDLEMVIKCEDKSCTAIVKVIE